ncbi:myosin-10-like [Aricia agestis]|uniref:myosin-10-like n=1 Tax=Aricia agestis TaxID=91739 RepID=UPI001C203BF1|nr:myosin-10-like [Aricia agestis]
MAKAKADYNREKAESLRLLAEEQVAETARAAREARASLRKSPTLAAEDAARTSAALSASVEKSLETISMVASKSSNLKGTFQRYLKEAVANIKEAVADMRDRCQNEEIRALEAQNQQLQQQIGNMRRELEELRRQVSKPATDEMQKLLSEVSRSNIETFGNMLNARLAGLEDRLLPEPRRRPPLASDAAVEAPVEGGPPVAASKLPVKKKKKTATQAAGPSQAPATSVPPKEGGKKRRKKKSLAAREAEQTRARTSAPSATDPSWSTVEPRGRKEKKGKGAAKKAAPKRKKKGKLRPRRSAAITLTLEKGVDQSVTYASILKEATSRIDLEAVGIYQRSNKVRFRLARTGARILEVSGEDAQLRADALANKLREVLDRDAVKIARPVQRVDVLVSGMDDAATAADVTKAAAKEGGCPATDIRTGRMTVGPRGARSLWLHVPTAAAKKLVTSGRLQVGWVMAKVVLLAARPMRCYRCLDTGHLASSCQSLVDRSGDCFRCGKPGHKAADCAEEKPSCFFCAELGKESAHVLGGSGCITAAKKLPSGARRKRKAPSKARLRKRPGADEAGASQNAPAMEVEA